MAVKKRGNKWDSSSILGGSRYIFFKSLLTSESKDLQNLGQNAANKFQQLAIQEDGKIKNTEQLQYIQNYINMLNNLAYAEQAQEIKYVNFLIENTGMKKEKFYSGKTFNYIEFIHTLNEVKKGTKLLKSIIATNKSNIRKTNKMLKEIKAENKTISVKAKTLTDQGENGPKKDVNLYDYIKDSYTFAYNNYKKEMQNRITESFNKSLSEQLSDYLNSLFYNVGYDSKFISAVIQRLAQQGISSENYTSIIQNLCVEFAIQQLKKHQWDVSKIAKEIKVEDLDTLLKQSEKDTYYRVMESKRSELERVLDDSIRTGRGIAAELEKFPNTLKELLDTLDVDNETRNVIETMFSNIQKINKGEKVTDEIKQKEISLQTARSKLTREINILIDKKYKQLMKDSDKKDKDSRENFIIQVIQQHLQQAQANGTYDMNQIFYDKIKITKISADGAAELIASQDLQNNIAQNIYTLFIPGKAIQYKADLTFGVSILPIKIKQQIIKDLNIPDWGIDIIENKTRHFMETYDAIAGGSTNVELAEVAYRNVLYSSFALKQKLLDEAEDELAKSKIEQLFDSQLDGAISVKEYQFYDNEQGFHMGSMGGSGRVIEAVPNILKMLELGGINVPDAELIISALLNSFKDSVIGTTLLEDIKTLLIGGAAMMLFDDGFANCEAYLEKLKSQVAARFNTNTIPGGGSIHLLQLNGLFYPQSFILFNIVNQLTQIYNDLVTEQDKMTSNFEFKTSNDLKLNNPLSESILKEANTVYDTPFERWNAVSQFAQQNVTIHFLFMAGMLDILQRLSKFGPNNVV